VVTVKRKFGQWLPVELAERGEKILVVTSKLFGLTEVSPMLFLESDERWKRFQKRGCFTFHDNYSWKRKRESYWTRRVVIMPQGEPSATFMVGFYLPGLGAQVFVSQQRKVADGPYAMLAPTGECTFFALGDKPVALEKKICFNAGDLDESATCIDLY
jgi:hypothetical protein